MNASARLLFSSIVFSIACAGNEPIDSMPDDAGASETAPPNDGSASGDGLVGANDFPAAPIITGGAPPNAPALFGSGGSPTGGPCLAEPEIGTLFPNNWLRPRFRLLPSGGQNLFEIRLHAAAEPNDLLVYTMATTWTMPANMWAGLSTNIVDQPITITVRGAVFDGVKLASPPALGSNGDVSIAPVNADGAIVYWVVPPMNGGKTFLKGFKVGQESVQQVMDSSQVPTSCIGCHASTPDGQWVALNATNNGSDATPSFIAIRSVSSPTVEPPFLTPSAKTLLARTGQYAPVLSKAHWAPNDRIVVTNYSTNGTQELVWIDLEATSTAQGVGWGILACNGDPGAHYYPSSFSHDGMHLAYISTADGAVHTVPYGNRMGGTSTKISGAPDPNFVAYDPTFSADDQLLSYVRMPQGQSGITSDAELFVVPSSGGTATRLAANDPAACTGTKSPGVHNTWGKWSPKAVTASNKTYHWLIFSSTRIDGQTAQLFVTGVVVQNSQLTTYPALYLWNQPATENNFTPAWDVFDIPPPK